MPFRVRSRALCKYAAMRWILTILVALFMTSPAMAQGEFSNCVPTREMTSIVSQNKFVAPTAAVVTARRSVGNADVVRANLCHREDGYVYVIVALKKDGRAMQVLVNPESGKVVETQ